ncbi:MAG: DotU family type IV/VI secretion system protein [Desulfamplus sp.]|nr:DotU family type IV/VI secretion system protein [Desulfamplus sp.]
MKYSVTDCLAELFAFTYYLADHPSEFSWEDVKKKYDTLIQGAKDFGKKSGISPAAMDKALFAVYAWIDETLLEISWKGRDEWAKNPLQKIHFNTTNAGETFFKKLEKLNSGEEDILQIYQYCLASGFKGCYFQSFHKEQLDSFRQDALKKLPGGSAPDPGETIFPESGPAEIPGLPPRRRWKGLAGFSYIFILLPTLVFLVLFYIYNNRLVEMMK